jgi:superfamily II DNA helicase RecQ
VIDTGSTNVAAVTWEAPREDEESFRDYAARRAASFGYPSLRDGQVDALEKLIEYKRDVMLIAKTSFGKSLIFQLAPLLLPDPKQPGIALVIMPLTLLQQNQSENVMKRGGNLGVRCIVLDGDSNTRRNREQIGEGKYTHSKHT